MDKEFLNGWFEGFSKGLDRLGEPQQEMMLDECGRACAARAARIFREEAALSDGLESFLARLSGRVENFSCEKAGKSEAVFCFHTCVCGLARENLTRSERLCVCARGSLESGLEAALGPGSAQVILLQSIAGGAECCRFAVRLGGEVRWGAPKLSGPAAEPAAGQERKPMRSEPRRHGRTKAPELVRAQRELAMRDRTWRVTAPIQIILLVGIMAMGGALSLFAAKPEESALERRKLAEKPAFTLAGLTDGTFVQKLEAFYADTFPLRDTLIGAAGHIEDLYGVRMDGARIHNAGNTGEQPEPAASSPADPAAMPEPENKTQPEDPEKTPREVRPANPNDESALGEKVGPVFVINGEAMSIFGPGGNAQADYYARTLNDWKQALGPGVTQYSLIVPTHIEFALPEKYKDISAPQKPNIDYIYSKLDPSIRAVDAYSKLEEHRDEYLYFRTDHHWTGLGAYYGYTAFCEKAGLTPAPLDSMEKRSITDFIGSMYAQANQDPELLKRPDHVDYWLPKTTYEVAQYYRGSPFTAHPGKLFVETAASPNCYSVFLGGDYPLTKIATGLRNGRKIAVVKESFGNAFIPFLVDHYEEIYVVDQRYYQLNLPALMQQNGIGEILFINNIFAANTTVRISEVARLRTQVYQPPVVKPENESGDVQEKAESGKKGEEADDSEKSSSGAESEESKESSSSKPKARKRTTSSSRRFINEFERNPDEEYEY